MKKFKYFALGGIFTGLVVSYNGGTNLSNTTGMSCTSNFTARSVATDSRNRVHVVWGDVGDTLESKLSSQPHFAKWGGSFRKAGKDFKQDLNLYYRRSLDGGTTWEDTIRLADAVGMPSIATNDLDIVHIVWPQEGISYKRSIDGGVNWENDTLLGVDNTSIGPAIATVGENLAHIVWREEIDSATYKFLYTRSIDGGTNWNTSTQIVIAGNVQIDSTTTALPCPSLSAANNLVHLVWQNSYDDSLGEIYYRHSADSGGSWESTKRLTSDTMFSFFPTVASSGNLVYVGWLEAVSTDSFMHYSFRRSTNGGVDWENPVCLIPSEPIDWALGTPQLNARDELVAVIWKNAVEESLGIWFKYSTDSGLNWGTAKCVRLDTADVYYPSAAIDDSGHLHIVWTDTRDGNPEVYYAKYSLLGIEEETKRTSNLTLSVNPNPFNAGTQIRFEVPTSRATEVSLRIYNISGKLVRTLLKGKRISGVYTTGWDAKDDRGRTIENGVYFCRFATKNHSITKKVILIK
ncbi:T9SS type A sorting domain-containing protein [candidate division WOR-3 bacterium]|nr:T9SS type A sorting domain-containing protein [candidate division WOR-3 bacterium]